MVKQNTFTSLRHLSQTRCATSCHTDWNRHEKLGCRIWLSFISCRSQHNLAAQWEVVIQSASFEMDLGQCSALLWLQFHYSSLKEKPRRPQEKLPLDVRRARHPDRLLHHLRRVLRLRSGSLFNTSSGHRHRNCLCGTIPPRRHVGVITWLRKPCGSVWCVMTHDYAHLCNTT